MPALVAMFLVYVVCGSMLASSHRTRAADGINIFGKGKDAVVVVDSGTVMRLSGEIDVDTILIGPQQSIIFEPGSTIKSRLVISSPAR